MLSHGPQVSQGQAAGGFNMEAASLENASSYQVKTLFFLIHGWILILSDNFSALLKIMW